MLEFGATYCRVPRGVNRIDIRRSGVGKGVDDGSCAAQITGARVTGGMSMDQPAYLGVGHRDLHAASNAADDRVMSVLQRSSLWSGLGHVVAALGPSSTLLKLPRKRALYSQGAPATALFVIASGRVRVARASADRQLTVAYRGPLELVGETALLGTNRYHDGATATESVEAVSIPVESVKQLMAVESALAARMLELMVERRVDAERRIEGLLARTVESRVASFLADAAKRYGIPESRGVLVGVKYTHQEIGDYVGSTRETVTLTLGELKRRGLIAFDHRRVIVVDMDGLERLSA